MADTIVFFSTSYHEKMLEEYKIFIQDKQQEDYFSFKKGDYVIFINELKLSSDKNKEIKIKITDKNNLENIYKIKSNYDKDIIFLLDYDLEEISKAFKYININSLIIWRNDRKYINENFSFHENFSFFFSYLLKEKEDIAKYKKIYKELIRTYLEKIKDENIPIDIAISILIIYQELKDLDEYLSIIKRIEKNSECGIIKIKVYKDFYLKEICNCLRKLLEFKKEDKYLILEIITIFFIKYNDKNLDILLSIDFKEMFINIFKKQLIFLDEKYIDDDVSQRIIKHIPEIENIKTILKKCENLISFLKRINDSFDDIFKAISTFGKLKRVFKIKDFKGFKVSQNDDISACVKIHEELIQKLENKEKNFIRFSPIFEEYFTLYSKYNNLDGLCELLIMLLLEEKKLLNINNNLKDNIVLKIKSILKQRIENNEISSKNIVKVLLRLKDVFNDEYYFDYNDKKIILNYFIKKCKEKDYETMKLYSKNKIYELFRNSDIKKNILIITLKNEEFDMNNDFIRLLPDELNNDELNIVIDIINNTVEKNNNEEMQDKYSFYNAIFKRNDFIKILNMLRLNDIKIINLFVGFLNKNEGELLKDKIKFLNDKYFCKNIFFMNINNNNICIPVYILNKMKNHQEFKELLINKLADFIINEQTIFCSNKNNRFLLLEELIENKYFLFDYKNKTLNFISEIIKRRKNYSYEKIIKIVKNYNNNKNFYNKVKNILTEQQQYDLKDFYNEISSDTMYIESLQKMSEFLTRLFPSKAEDDILSFNNYIYDINKGKINSKENFKKNIDDLTNKYKEKINKYFNYSKSKIFYF